MQNKIVKKINKALELNGIPEEDCFIIKLKNLDKFYTPKKTVELLIKEIDLDDYDLIIEPSAGNGSFLPYLPKKKTVALDIEPEHKDIIKKDFFTYFPDKKYKNILVIGNPPFGKNSSLAVKFFNHSAKFANTILMILPKTFKKVSIQNRLDLDFHLEKDIEINEHYLVGEKEQYVPTVGQLWIRKEEKREKVQIQTISKYFEFVDKKDAELSIRRVGYYAGTCFYELDKSASSHYFIKSNIDKDKLFEIINGIDWEHDNTAGTRSISKHELIIAIDKEILQCA